MHFWSVLGKTKPGIETTRCILRLKRFARGSQVILRSKRYVFQCIWGLVKCPLRRKFELVSRAKCQFWSQMDPLIQKVPLETHVDAFSSFMVFILPEFDENCTFDAISAQILPNASKMVIFSPKIACKVHYWPIVG